LLKAERNSTKITNLHTIQQPTKVHSATLKNASWKEMWKEKRERMDVGRGESGKIAEQDTEG